MDIQWTAAFDNPAPSFTAYNHGDTVGEKLINLFSSNALLLPTPTSYNNSTTRSSTSTAPFNTNHPGLPEELFEAHLLYQAELAEELWEKFCHLALLPEVQITLHQPQSQHHIVHMFLRACLQRPAALCQSENAVVQAFSSTVLPLVDHLTRAFGIRSELENVSSGPVRPDHLWKAGQAENESLTGVLVLEFKRNSVGRKHFKDLSQACEGGYLDHINLHSRSIGWKSMVAKIAWYLNDTKTASASFAILMDANQFIILQVRHRTPAFIELGISRPNSVSNGRTPLVPIVTWMLVNHVRGGDGSDLGGGTAIVEGDAAEDSPDETGSPPENNPPDDPDNSEDCSDDSKDSSRGSWTYNDVIMHTLTQVAFRWSLTGYSKVVWIGSRLDDSTVWNPSFSSAGHRRSKAACTLPPSPPPTPLEICVTRRITRYVFSAHWPPQNVPVVLKLAVTDAAQHELSIYQRLRHMAGTEIPGVHGVYSIEGSSISQAFIVEQDVGFTLSTFRELSFLQQWV
ncbi:hypothetical protein FRB90_001292 [Tulasnella sp. 427]|nr:hypothetical protein FRB90_001292 [Tulasnella sp. 427]